MQNRKPLPQPSEIVHSYLLDYDLKYGPSILDAFHSYLEDNGCFYNKEENKIENNSSDEEIELEDYYYNDALKQYTPEEIRDFLFEYFKTEKEKEIIEYIKEMQKDWERLG